jgi:hypothetical protein
MAAGTGTIQIVTAQNCAWTAASNASWLTIKSGSAGTGNGTVSYAVTANSTGVARSGSIMIAGQMVAVNQAGSAAATPALVRLQPAPGPNDGTDDGSAAKGKDTFAWQGCGGIPDPNTIHGADAAAIVESSTCNCANGFGYLQFSTAGMPASSILSAKIFVHTNVLAFGGGWASDPVFGLRKVTSSWNENTLNWNLQPSYDSAAIGSRTVTGAVGLSNSSISGWVSFDVTDLYKGWVGGGTANYGVRLSHENGFCLNMVQAQFDTSDATDAAIHPYLEVSYGNAATGVPTMTPAVLAALAILLAGLAAYSLRKPHGSTGSN